MSTKMTRRDALTAVALVAMSGAVTQIALADGRAIGIRVDGIRSLEGMGGEELHAALQRRLVIELPDGMDAMDLVLLAVRVREGRVADVFVSDGFEMEGGRGYGTLGRGNFPRPDFLPGDMFIPGHVFLPGDMFYPAYSPEDRAGAAAMDHFDGGSGLFFVVIARDPELREKFPSQGTMMPLAG